MVGGDRRGVGRIVQKRDDRTAVRFNRTVGERQPRTHAQGKSRR
jgi:hypothetical protein